MIDTLLAPTTTPTRALLSSRAMLVSLTIRQWSGVQEDKNVAAEIARLHGAAEDTGKFAKFLVPRSALEPLNKLAGEVYTEHRRRTLPWLDGGTRILSSIGYFEYTEFLRRKSDEWDELADKFAADYPGYVQSAQSTLGSLFDLLNYPAPSKIRAKFSIERRTSPLPDVADFRCDLGPATEAIREEMAQSATVILDQAMTDVRTRIQTVVGHMATKLGGYTGERAGAFRDSLVENVRELVDILPSLNITADPMIDQLAERMRRELCAYDADTLRKDDTAREHVADEADAILAQMSAFI